MRQTKAQNAQLQAIHSLFSALSKQNQWVFFVCFVFLPAMKTCKIPFPQCIYAFKATTCIGPFVVVNRKAPLSGTQPTCTHCGFPLSTRACQRTEFNRAQVFELSLPASASLLRSVTALIFSIEILFGVKGRASVAVRTQVRRAQSVIPSGVWSTARAGEWYE